MPWLGFTFLMGHMSVSHIYRHYVNDPDTVDITGAQMVLVMKLTAFCWNVHDGRLPDEELEDIQRDRALKELPNLLDYAGYVFFFPSLMVGPAFDFVEYTRWLETTMFDVPPGTDPSKAPKTRKKRRIPRSGTPATVKAVKGVLWIVAFLKFSGWFYSDLVIGTESLKYGLLHRIFNLHMLGFATRCKYYGVWFLAEGSCILSGIGYKGLDPKTGRPDWDRLQNVNPLGIELAQNSRAYLGSWNMNTNNWLRNYMYLRVTPKGKKPGFAASMCTFVTSALWHGFEPGYYMAFVLAAFLQTVAKSTSLPLLTIQFALYCKSNTHLDTRRHVRPLFLSATGVPLASKRYYDILTYIATQLAFSFTVAPFILLSFRDSFTAWQRVYFYCIIGVVISLGAFADASPVRGWLKKRVAAQNKAAGGAARSEGSEIEFTEQGKGLATGTSSQPSSSSINERERERPGFLDRTDPNASKHGAYGVSDDPGRDLDELMEQVKEEVRVRRERGMSVGQSLQEAVQSRWGSGISADVDGEGNVSVRRR